MSQSSSSSPSSPFVSKQPLKEENAHCCCSNRCPLILVDQIWEKVYSRSLTLIILLEVIYSAYFATLIYSAPTCVEALDSLANITVPGGSSSTPSTLTNGTSTEQVFGELSSLQLAKSLQIPQIITQAGYFWFGCIANLEYTAYPTFMLSLATLFSFAYGGIGVSTRLASCSILVDKASALSFPTKPLPGEAGQYISNANIPGANASIPVPAIVFVEGLLWLASLISFILFFRLTVYSFCGRLGNEKHKLLRDQPPPPPLPTERDRTLKRFYMWLKNVRYGLRLSPLRLLIALSASLMGIGGVFIRLRAALLKWENDTSLGIKDLQNVPVSSFPSPETKNTLILFIQGIDTLFYSCLYTLPVASCILIISVIDALSRRAHDHELVIKLMNTSNTIAAQRNDRNGNGNNERNVFSFGGEGSENNNNNGTITTPRAILVPLPPDTSSFASSSSSSVSDNPFLKPNVSTVESTVSSSYDYDDNNNNTLSSSALPSMVTNNPNYQRYRKTSATLRRPSRLNWEGNGRRANDLSYFSHFAAFSFVTTYMSSIILIQIALMFVIAVPVFIVLYEPTQKYAITAAVSAAFTAVLEVLDKSVLRFCLLRRIKSNEYHPQYPYLPAGSLYIFRPRMFLLIDFIYTYTIGAIAGFTLSIVRLLVHAVWSLLRATHLHRSLWPRPFSLFDPGYWAYGSMLTLAYIQQPPPFVGAQSSKNNHQNMFGSNPDKENNEDNNQQSENDDGNVSSFQDPHEKLAEEENRSKHEFFQKLAVGTGNDETNNNNFNNNTTNTNSSSVPSEWGITVPNTTHQSITSSSNYTMKDRGIRTAAMTTSNSNNTSSSSSTTVVQNPFAAALQK